MDPKIHVDGQCRRVTAMRRGTVKPLHWCPAGAVYNGYCFGHLDDTEVFRFLENLCDLIVLAVTEE